MQKRNILMFAAAIGLFATACGSGGGTTPNAAGTTPPPSGSAAPSSSAYNPVIDPANFQAVVDNPWFPLKPGSVYVYKGVKDGEPVRDLFVVTLGTQKIDGVPCVIVHDQLFHADGTLVDRAAFLRQIAPPCPVSDFGVEDVRIRVLGDTAIAHGRTTYTKPDGQAAAGRYTDVWVRQGGRWVCVSGDVTRG